MKKNWAIIAKVTTSAIRLAPIESRLRNSLNSMIGAFTRSSIATKAAVSTTDPASRPMMAGEPQPHELPSMSARSSAESPPVIAATPR